MKGIDDLHGTIHLWRHMDLKTVLDFEIQPRSCEVFSDKKWIHIIRLRVVETHECLLRSS
jgi:hypothetical protein